MNRSDRRNARLIFRSDQQGVGYRSDLSPARTASATGGPEEWLLRLLSERLFHLI
jgi:hypothetical protein